MATREKIIGGMSAGLTALAIAIFVFAKPVPLRADSCSCFYGGEEYPHGSCFQGACPPGEVHTCAHGWLSDCASECLYLGGPCQQ
jgi:hypothetical protein